MHVPMTMFAQLQLACVGLQSTASTSSPASINMRAHCTAVSRLDANGSTATAALSLPNRRLRRASSQIAAQHLTMVLHLLTA